MNPWMVDVLKRLAEVGLKLEIGYCGRFYTVKVSDNVFASSVDIDEAMRTALLLAFRDLKYPKDAEG